VTPPTGISIRRRISIRVGELSGRALKVTTDGGIGDPVELVRCGSDSRVQDELFGGLQGDDFGAPDGLLPEVVGQGDQWRGGGNATTSKTVRRW